MLLITRSVDGDCNIRFEPTGAELNDYLGRSLKFECDIINASAKVQTIIYQQVNGTWSTVPSEYTTTGKLAITSDIDTNATRVQFRIKCNNLASAGTCSFRNFIIYLT